MTSSFNDTQNVLTLNRFSITEESCLSEKISDIYEKEIEYLNTQLMRINSYSSILNSKKHDFDPSFSQWRLSNKLLNDNEERQNFLTHLKEEFIRVNSLVTEANIISNEMQRQIVYNVILQIPVSYFKPSERTMNNLCEPAIQVKRGSSSPQIWNIEKFEFRLNKMRTIYDKWKISENKTDLLIKELKRMNPFYDEESDHLIGIANIYLKALFYNSKLDYIVPIINTQGEISGSLHVVLDQTGSSSMKKLSDFQINSMARGSMSEGISADADDQSLSNYSNSQHSFEDEGIDEPSTLSNGKADQITVKFAIKEARDLPQSDAGKVMCRYTFINPKLDQTVTSVKPPDNDEIKQKAHTFSFNHENEYTFPITDHFLSTCLESSISIEVWYQYNSKSQSIDAKENDEVDRRDVVIQELKKQWKDVKRHIHFIVEIHELDPTGQWGPVEVDAQEEIISGGIYRLKQGQSKRLVVQLRVLPRSDGMPLLLHAIRSVEIGSISTRKTDAPLQLDSYQDEDLLYLRREWLNLIEKRKLHIESQVNMLNQETDKSPNDIQKENILLEQLAYLAEERDIAVLTPSGSGIPGSPAAWNPPLTTEQHRPLIYLNLDPIKMNTTDDTAGLQAILYEENKTKMFQLPLIQNASDQIRAVAQWDPSIHESSTMNQVTPNDALIYLIVKIIVMISEPVQIEFVLRKRIAVTISKTEGWSPGKTLKNLLGYKTYKRTSVVYEIVSNIPKSLHDVKDQNQLNPECLSQDHIGKYIQYASAIDSLLLLDKLRQEVLLAENSAKQQTMRKATSAPNITHQKRKTNTFNSPVNTRRENQYSTIPNETISSLIESELNSSTPSMISRSLFIEEEGLQAKQPSSFRIKHPIDLDDNTQEDNENTLEEKYAITPIQRIESPSKQIIDDKNEDYSIGCRVIVNTGHYIFNKPGIIRFIGPIAIKEGIWYGIQLEEPVGKNNGSLDGRIYFECPNKHGVFVRCDKIRLVN